MEVSKVPGEDNTEDEEDNDQEEIKDVLTLQTVTRTAATTKSSP